KFILLISNHGDVAAHVGLIATGQGSRDRHVGLLADAVADKTVSPGSEITVPLTLLTSADAITVPHAQHLYDSKFLGLPFAASALVDVGGVGFPILGYRLIDVVPAVEIAETIPNLFVSCPDCGRSENKTSLTLLLINHQDSAFHGLVTV